MDVLPDARGSVLKALVAHMAEGVIVLDADARVMYMNPEAERLLGWTSTELQGRRAQAVMPDLAEHQCLAGKPVRQAREEIAFSRRDGSPLPVACLTAPMIEADRVIGSVVLFRDLPPQQQAQAALVRTLAETQQQLIRSQKLASIGQLAAGIAHEINNPVGYVSSNLTALTCDVNALFELLAAYRALEPDVAPHSPALARLRELTAGEKYDFIVQDLPDLLHESGEGMARIRRIVQDLKDFSRAVPDDWQANDLHRGLDSTLNILHHEIKYKAEIVRDYGDIPPVECIGSQINQVFMNLLINAVQAIERQGTIVVSTTCPDADHVCVRITDDGAGMTKEVMAHIFDPFFTTKPVGQGTGLGLALSYAIVTKHGGRIEVESEPRKGTTFRVLLPVHRVHEQKEHGCR